MTYGEARRMKDVFDAVQTRWPNTLTTAHVRQDSIRPSDPEAFGVEVSVRGARMLLHNVDAMQEIHALCDHLNLV